jgi:eukaryotic-like serine/threonine-protein kinase
LVPSESSHEEEPTVLGDYESLGRPVGFGQGERIRGNGDGWELLGEHPRVLGNRYEVGDLLGRGGMAEVYLGRDTRLGRTVAIKVLRLQLAHDPTFQARFRREAQNAAALNHPAIVAVYDTGQEMITAGGGPVPYPYIVMEHIEGRTLRDILSEGRPLDVDLALDITAGVLAALEYSHRIGVVHRDIKPANVMLIPSGDVKVMDFGIARALADAESTMTVLQTRGVIGTAQYLSPEQARGELVDTRSDLYSTGCLLFELLTCRPPFVADSPVAVAYQHVREQPPAPSDLASGIPESVDRISLHALAKDREERYQTAAEFRADIEAARAGRQVAAYPVPVAPGLEDELPQSSVPPESRSRRRGPTWLPRRG